MLMNIWVKDKQNGRIHKVGTDIHDSLIFIDGAVEYHNLQNGDGTPGGYEFIEVPDMDGYINVTPDELRLNRELLHRDLEKRKAEKKH